LVLKILFSLKKNSYNKKISFVKKAKKQKKAKYLFSLHEVVFHGDCCAKTK